ncbi:hypothetical protein HanIR_Chr09g0398891 [Helianthus annuus]|nr:hypothetical protein HanIR_Chr09g0398891 [Helianthus annuus]
MTKDKQLKKDFRSRRKTISNEKPVVFRQSHVQGSVFRQTHVMLGFSSISRQPSGFSLGAATCRLATTIRQHQLADFQQQSDLQT